MAEERLEHDPTLAQPAEAIHMPDPSYLPFVLALGITITLVGVLTGIIVGGTSILGGEGTIGRTVLGCLFVALIANGFNLLGLDPFYQQVTLGVILLLAVGVDAWSRRFE